MTDILNTVYSIEEVFDYIDCPLRHHMKYEKKLPPAILKDTTAKSQIFKDCIKEAIFFYYARMQEKNPASIKELYNKYYTLWLARTNTIEANIFERSLSETQDKIHKERDKYVLNGYSLLQKFYNWNHKKKQSIIAVNHPYEVEIDGIKIKGRFELIREVERQDQPGRILEIVEFKTTKKKPEGFDLNHDLYSTFMHYAFLYTFKASPDKFIVNYLNQDKELEITRDANEYKRMLSVLKGFTNSVNTVAPYPKQNFQCNYCPFKEYCDNWKFD